MSNKNLDCLLDSITDKVEYCIQQYQPISTIERLGIYVYRESPSVLAIKTLEPSAKLKISKCNCGCTLRIENLSASHQQTEKKALVANEPYYRNRTQKNKGVQFEIA